MMKRCDCEDYKNNMPKINLAITLADIHGFSLPDSFVYFRYCPWCGKEIYEEFVGDSDHEHDDRIL